MHGRRIVADTRRDDAGDDLIGVFMRGQGVRGDGVME
jgi:hypothetical protein